MGFRGSKRLFVSLGFAVAIALFSQASFAFHLLYSAENIFFENPGTRRFGIEMELTGLDLQTTAQIVARALGGVALPIENRTDALRVVAPGLKDTIVKVEHNQTTEAMSDKKNWVLEIVLPPVTFDKISKLQHMADLLKAAGAKGTDSGAAVSVQVNLEIGANGKTPEAEFQDVLNLVRTYYKPSHQAQIDRALKTPDFRQPYLGKYSDGMMAKLFDRSYNPTIEQFHFDYFYRQSLELSGVKNAWSMTEDEARVAIEKLGYPIVPRVVKIHSLRISSYLMLLQPNDPYTKAIAASEWAVARPLVEFRDWNNRFDILHPAKQASGLLTGAARYGNYEHDKLVSKLTGTPEVQLPALREVLYEHQDRADRTSKTANKKARKTQQWSCPWLLTDWLPDSY